MREHAAILIAPRERDIAAAEVLHRAAELAGDVEVQRQHDAHVVSLADERLGQSRGDLAEPSRLDVRSRLRGDEQDLFLCRSGFRLGRGLRLFDLRRLRLGLCFGLAFDDFFLFLLRGFRLFFSLWLCLFDGLFRLGFGLFRLGRLLLGRLGLGRPLCRRFCLFLLRLDLGGQCGGCLLQLDLCLFGRGLGRRLRGGFFASFSCHIPSSNGLVFDDDDRIVLRAADRLVLRHGDVLVGDRIAKFGILHDPTVLHDDGIADVCPLLDDDAAEEDAVLHPAVDLAAVGDQRIANAGARAVLGRDGVFDLCEDLAAAIEQVVADVGVEDAHALGVVRLDVVDDRRISVDVIGVDAQLCDVLLNDVLFEVGIAALIAVRDQRDQQIFFEQIDVEPDLGDVLAERGRDARTDGT